MANKHALFSVLCSLLHNSIIAIEKYSIALVYKLCSQLHCQTGSQLHGQKSIMYV